jgi:hypothetical protein
VNGKQLVLELDGGPARLPSRYLTIIIAGTACSLSASTRPSTARPFLVVT